MPPQKQRDQAVVERLSKFHVTETLLWYDQYERAYRARERSAPPKGTRFQLSKVEFWEIVFRALGTCEITKQPFDRYHKAPTGKRPFIPTIDRVNSTGHYTPDNCELVTWIANVAISDFGRDAFLEMVKHGIVSPALRKHLEAEEKALGVDVSVEQRLPTAFDNILPFIRDGAVGRFIARHLFSVADSKKIEDGA